MKYRLGTCNNDFKQLSNDKMVSKVAYLQKYKGIVTYLKKARTPKRDVRVRPIISLLCNHYQGRNLTILQGGVRNKFQDKKAIFTKKIYIFSEKLN